MKKVLLILFVLFLFFGAKAQEENKEEKKDDRKGKFKKEHIFFGTGLNIGAGGGMFQIGVTPEVGYSIAQWLDAGFLLIVNYQSQNNAYYSDPFSGNVYGPYKARNFNYGTGGFIRLWPLDFLHLTAQPEFNWIRVNITDQFTGEKSSGTFKSTSLLVGIGYGGRTIGNSYQYITLMKDLRNDEYSPYRDPAGRSSLTIKAGIGLYLGRH